MLDRLQPLTDGVLMIMRIGVGVRFLFTDTCLVSLTMPVLASLPTLCLRFMQPLRDVDLFLNRQDLRVFGAERLQQSLPLQQQREQLVGHLLFQELTSHFDLLASCQNLRVLRSVVL